MQEILELCVRLDSRAEQLYENLADACTDSKVSAVFRQMEHEERQHVQWWVGLLGAWNEGLLPDIADEHGILTRLHDIEKEFDGTVPADIRALTTDEMLSLAAHFEFYMLDPVFGELIDLMEPGRAGEHRRAYSRHVMRLVEVIETHHGNGSLASFLARVLVRSYHDQQRLAALATRDQLTGLFNRRGLFGHLKQWLSWSARYERPLGLALIDIDRFKSINDRYGHAAGDRAMEQVARSLERATRSSDVIGRFGGDEFLVIAPEVDEAELEQLLGRIVTVVHESPIAVDSDTVFLSVSVGGSWIRGGAPIDPDAAIALADRSLYEAKAAGRDRAGEPLLAGPATTV